MTQNNDRKGRKNKGVKRPATALNNGNNEHIIQPGAKKQRTEKYQSSRKAQHDIQSLLTMSQKEVDALPDIIREQAIALRQIQQNNNNNDDGADSDYVDDYDHGRDNMYDESSESNDQDDAIDDPQSYIAKNNTRNDDTRNRVNTNIRTAYRYNQPITSMTSRMHIPPPMPPPTRPVPPLPPFSQPPSKRLNRSEASHFQSLHYTPNTNNIGRMNGNNNVPFHFENDTQPLKIKTQQYNEEKIGLCSCFSNLLWMILAFLLFFPFFTAISIPNFQGKNYCDNGKNWIKRFDHENNIRYDNICNQCPIDAMCIGGRARCNGRHFFVDTESNECVKSKSYRSRVWSGYKQMYEIGIEFIYKCGESMYTYYNTEMIKWRQIKEWKKSYNTFKGLTWSEFSKLYEMEICVSFFVLARYLPSIFHCLIIFLFSNLLLPGITGDDDQGIKIGIRLLSYFAPIVFGYNIWNNVVSFFTN